MNTVRLGYGPLLLLLYQAAPVSVQHDSLGRYRISVGYATGQWENEEFGCDGQLISATPVRHHSAGVQIDAWPADHIRLTAFAGKASQSIGVTQSADSEYGQPFVEPFAGGYGGVQLAYEGQKAGLGVGMTHLNTGQGSLQFAPYLRIGNIDRTHFRLDVMTPNPALPSVSWARMGVGINNGHLRGPGGFVGVGFGPFDYNNKAAFLGELHFPIARGLAAQVHGLAGEGELNGQWSIGGGLRFDFGPKHK